MFRGLLARPLIARIILCLQLLPLLVLPSTSYSLATQEWWLPAFLALLTVISLVKILMRRSIAAWPWYLMAFSQGFNIISRLMTLFPHATVLVDGKGLVANGEYIAIAIGAMLFSAFELWYSELPEVRQRMAPKLIAQAS